MSIARSSSCATSQSLRSISACAKRPRSRYQSPPRRKYFHHTVSPPSHRTNNLCHNFGLYPELFPRAKRRFTNAAVLHHGHIDPPKPGEEINVTFVDKEGDEHSFEVSEGDNLLDIAQANDLEMEGACGGSCACSTCHVIVENEEMYDRIPEPDDDENDMLDLAFGLTETSRLGCQVKMKKDIDGLRVKLPSMTRNLQASDFSGAKK